MYYFSLEIFNIKNSQLFNIFFRGIRRRDKYVYIQFKRYTIIAAIKYISIYP